MTSEGRDPPMMFRLSILLPAVAGSAIAALAAGSAIAGPAASRIDIALDRLVRPVFDDGGWRVRRHKCCRGGLDGSGGARILERGHARRLGEARNRYDNSPTYGDRNDDGYFSRYGGESIYEQRLTPPRVFQPGAGGGYFGNPD